jgi:hypothetical protein
MSTAIVGAFIDICRAVTADGKLVPEEVWYLANWLNEHPDAMKVWPGSLFVDPLNAAFVDGVLSKEEIQEIARLIEQVEREYSAQRKPREIVREQPTGYSVQEVRLPSIPYSATVQSFSSEDLYSVRLNDCSCTCPDWATRRASFPVDNPSRLCKHAAAAFQEFSSTASAVLPEWLLGVVDQTLRYGRGVLPADHWLLVEVESKPYIVCYGKSEWRNVYTLDGEGCGSFGFNVNQNRWSYDIEPIHGNSLRKALLKIANPGPEMSRSASSAPPVPMRSDNDVLQELGITSSGSPAVQDPYLLTRILRPICYALRETFKGVTQLERSPLITLQKALLNWDYLPSLPAYGPQSTWQDLEASDKDPHRSLTKEERKGVIDLAYQVLPPDVFLSLMTNGMSRYKKQLDEVVRKDLKPG